MAHTYKVLATTVKSSSPPPPAAPRPLLHRSLQKQPHLHQIPTDRRIRVEKHAQALLPRPRTRRRSHLPCRRHGPMFDLVTDETLHKLFNEFYTANKIVSAACHGPAALVHVKLPDGEGYLLDGPRVTGFSNVKEEQVGLTAVMPSLFFSCWRTR